MDDPSHQLERDLEKSTGITTPTTTTATTTKPIPSFTHDDPRTIARRQRRHFWTRLSFVAVILLFQATAVISRDSRLWQRRTSSWGYTDDDAEARHGFRYAIGVHVQGIMFTAYLAWTWSRSRWPQLSEDGQPMPVWWLAPPRPPLSSSPTSPVTAATTPPPPPPPVPWWQGRNANRGLAFMEHLSLGLSVGQVPVQQGGILFDQWWTCFHSTCAWRSSACWGSCGGALASSLGVAVLWTVTFVGWRASTRALGPYLWLQPAEER